MAEERVKGKLASILSADVRGYSRLGQFHAYLAKFRSGSSCLTWSELATFRDLTDQATQRVLFTTCDEHPPAMKERSGFYCIR